MDIAIIGAGMAGLSCGEALVEAGHRVSLFDKGRGPGGRMATRRAATPLGEVQFDHGAQYFTARDPLFVQRVAEWERSGVVARWPEAKAGAWVGRPAMNAPIRAMAERFGVRFGERVTAVAKVDSGWRLDGVADAAVFDALVIAVPAEQVAPLLDGHAPDIARAANEVVSEPCWTVMAAFDERLDTSADTIRDRDAIGWAARNSAKPGRGETECWVVQATPAWSRAHLEEEPQAIVEPLLAQLRAMTGELPAPVYATAHRWRYAKVKPRQQGALWDAQARLGACGDWLSGPRVENAFLSGLDLASRIGRA